MPLHYLLTGVSLEIDSAAATVWYIIDHYIILILPSSLSILLHLCHNGQDVLAYPVFAKPLKRLPTPTLS